MKKIEQFQITSMSISGFKSYEGPTDLIFGNPTVITGGNGRGKTQGVGMHVLRPAVMQNPLAGFLKIRQDARFAAAPAEKAIPTQGFLLFKVPEHRQNGVTRAVPSPQIAVHTSAIAQMPVHIDADRPEQQPHG